MASGVAVNQRPRKGMPLKKQLPVIIIKFI
jgi:hypothetical protein